MIFNYQVEWHLALIKKSLVINNQIFFSSKDNKKSMDIYSNLRKRALVGEPLVGIMHMWKF